MKYLSAEKWWLCLPIYLLVGFVLGTVDPTLGRAVQSLGLTPGLATAAFVNVLMPLAAIGLAAVHVRWDAAWLGAVGMTATYILGLAIVHSQAQAAADTSIFGSIPPVLIMACAGYGILGTIAVFVTRTMNK